MSQVFTVTADELDRLHGTGPLAIAVYLHLRAWMDYSSGATGRTRAISLSMLAAYTEEHITRGNGVQIEQASQKAIRTSIDRLQRAGLLRRLPGDNLHFLLPMALNASARPNQTRHNGGTKQSTEPGTVEASIDAGLSDEPGTGNDRPESPFPAHIRFQVNLKPPALPVDNFLGNRTRSSRAGLAEKDVSDTDRLLMLGQRRGIEPRPGESWREYRYRLASAA